MLYCVFPDTARRVSSLATELNTACLDAAVFWPLDVTKRRDTYFIFIWINEMKPETN
eukprot:COSAG03_NODE_10_length_23829_cov_21.731395_27_plen_57_part_00